jgi:Protein of unknown function (DUF2630)
MRESMNESELHSSIEMLVNEEHALLQQAGDGAGLSEDQRARLHELEVKLDQYWDLLRQRRARREFGLDPDQASLRDPGTVEHYQQ